ncbi:MAG: phosphodiesterase [Oscillospiraceae bacterium]|nr:phosphodiesterase [Oscillospiraceae bacterium]
MKLMFASDIHGDADCCAQMLERFDNEKADKLFLLGDILYHGPRNDLPGGYAPKQVIKMLNERREKLLCVRGNCDTEVDQMVLDFPITADCSLLWLEGRTVFLTHGHIFNTENPPALNRGDILLHGHTHIQIIDGSRDYIYMNPGSVSLPKEGNPKTYMIYEDGAFVIRTLDGTDLNYYRL